VYELTRPTLNRSRRYSCKHPHTRTVTKTSKPGERADLKIENCAQIIINNYFEAKLETELFKFVILKQNWELKCLSG
jgi:hypothetical protein